MTIYGVAILACCFIVGKILGNLLGFWLGFNGDIGGVGFAMLLLIFANAYLKRRNLMPQESARGILFWSSMYIPIIVAMAATQNAKAALSGGWLAILAGTVVVCGAFALVPVLSRIGREPQTNTSDHD